MPESTRATSVDELIQVIQDCWRSLQPHLGELSPSLRKQLQQLSAALIGDIDHDNDQRNKAEVYGVVARFFRDRLKQPEPVCLAVVHRLCEEKDERILRMAQEPGKGALDPLAVGNVETRLREAVLSIKVRYEERERFRAFARRVEVYTNATNTGVDRAAFEQELPWEALPSDVREQQMRDPQPFQTFTLYRKEPA